MLPLSAATLLGVWERGLKKRPPERALALLESAFPHSPPEVLAEMSIGRRDAALLMLREWAFGQAITAVVACPRCGQRVEMAFTTSSLRTGAGGDVVSAEVSLAEQGYEVRMRLPNNADLLACADLDVAEAPKQIFSRCLIAASGK